MKKFIIGLVIILCALWVLNCKLTERLIVTGIEDADPTAVVEVLDSGIFTGNIRIISYANFMMVEQTVDLISQEVTTVASPNFSFVSAGIR